MDGWLLFAQFAVVVVLPVVAAFLGGFYGARLGRRVRAARVGD